MSTTTQIIKDYLKVKKEFDDQVINVSKGVVEGDYNKIADLYEKNREYHDTATYKYDIPAIVEDNIVIAVEDNQLTVLDMIRNTDTLDSRCRDLYQTMKTYTTPNAYSISLAEINILHSTLRNQYFKQKMFNDIVWDEV